MNHPFARVMYTPDQNYRPSQMALPVPRAHGDSPPIEPLEARGAQRNKWNRQKVPCSDLRKGTSFPFGGRQPLLPLPPPPLRGVALDAPF